MPVVAVSQENEEQDRSNSALCVHMAPLDLSKRHVIIQMLYLRLITWCMIPCLTHFRRFSISASENQAQAKYVCVHLCVRGISDGVKHLTASCNDVVRYFVKYY